MNLLQVDELLLLHHAEASDGLVDTAPSSLRRGEGTEKYFFIMKIDLVGSTALLWSRKQATYLRLAHTFLSTVDRITQEYGADADQVEYAGDGLLAYFPDRRDTAAAVLECAFYAKAAVDRMSLLPGAVGSLKPRCRVVLHYAPLTVARIGPRAASSLSAIGLPLHKVAKLEKDIAPGVGRVTEEFYREVRRDLRKYLVAVQVEERVLIQPAPVFNPFDLDGKNALFEALISTRPAPVPPRFEMRRKTVGYEVSWRALARDLK